MKYIITPYEQFFKDNFFITARLQEQISDLLYSQFKAFLTARAGAFKLDTVENEISLAYSNVQQLDGNKAQLAALRNASIEERYVIESASMALFSGGSSSSSAPPPIVGVPVSEQLGDNNNNRGGIVSGGVVGGGNRTGSRTSPAGTLVGKLGVTQADVDADFFESQKLPNLMGICRMA